MPVLLRDEWPPFAFGADHFDTMLQGAKGCTEVGMGGRSTRGSAGIF